MADIRIDISANDRASADMRRLRNEVESIDDNTRRSATSFQNLGNALTGLAAGAGIVAGIGATIWQMAEQGESIRDLGVQFETYLSALDRDANMLQRLRETTRGVVDDATLMRSAVDAYRLAGAETEDQILELINIGSTLGGGTAGVEALIGVLRNGSSAIEVLDTAGLSAGNVRARWQELKETMEDSDEAFRLAVLEEGRAQLDLFGEGLANQASAIDTWRTRFTNAFNGALEETAKAVEWWLDNALNPVVDAANAGVLDEALHEVIFGSDADRSLQIQEARALVEDVFDEVVVAAQEYAGGGLNFDRAGGVIREALTLAVANPDIFTSPEAAAQALEQLGYNVENNAELFDIYAYSLMAMSEQMAIVDERTRAAAEAQKYQNFEIQRAAALAGGYQQSLAISAQQNADFAVQLADQVLWMQSWNDSFNPEEMMSGMGAIAENLDTEFFTEASNFFSTITENRGAIEGITLFRPEEADALRQMADEYQAFVDRVDADPLFDDGTVARFQTGADYVRDMAEQAERGRDALKEMTLDQLLGTDDGGAGGELTDLIVAEARARGFTDAQIEEFTRLMDEETGRSTEESKRLIDEQIPLILATLQTNSAESAVATAIEILNQLATDAAGMPVEWSEDGFSAVQENITTPMQDARDATVEISENLATLTATPQRIVVELDVTAQPDALAAALAPFIARAVRDNGGTVPGENPRQGGGSTPR